MRLRPLIPLAIAALASAAGCGSKEEKVRGCDPLQTPGMTREAVEKLAAEALARTDSKGRGAKRNDSKCKDLDVVGVSNGVVGHEWYLKNGVVVGYIHLGEDGGMGCSGEVPVDCE
jgi:hypothetical protein